MSNEQKPSGREALEHGLKNISSFLRSARGVPGKPKLNSGHRSGAQDPVEQSSGKQYIPLSSTAVVSSVSLGGQSPPPGRRSPQLVQQDSVESGLYQLQLQASGDASKTASSSKDSSRHAGQLAAGAAAAGTAAAAAGDEAVSQSRASSQIRVKKFNKLLGEPLIDLDALRELSWSGIPQELRPTCWKLLLGYLPPNKSRQQQVLARKRREYTDMVPEFYDVENSQRSEDEIGALRQVSVDVPRTAPNVAFFHEPIIQKSLERLLYIWGIRHPASGYVQGMNDLVTPFVAVFLSEVLPGQIDTWTSDTLTEAMMLDVEADCYWCLSKLLDGIQDHYTDAQPGIQRTVFRVKELVSKNNGAIVAHLEAEGIDFLQFAFRWVNCLLIREVPFGAALRLWDTYLAEGPRFNEFLVYVCAAFLASWERDICRREFQELILFLQKLPTQEWGEAQIESVLSSAFVLRNTWASAQSHLQA